MPQSPYVRSLRLHSDRHRARSIPIKDENEDAYARSRPHNDHRHDRGRGWPFVDTAEIGRGAPSEASFSHPPQLQALDLSQHSDSAVVGNVKPFQHSKLNSFPQLNKTQASCPTPFLTVVLVKLHEILPEFCRRLTGEQQEKDEETGYFVYYSPNSVTAASQACRVLDTSIATASQNPNNHNKSNVTFAQPPFSRSPTLDPGKPSSPLSLRYWMPSSNSHPATTTLLSPSTSALALEGEFESFTSPFFLLAGAHVMAANFEHLHHSTSTACSLSTLYQLISADLQRTEVLLCEPFLRTSNESTDLYQQLHDSHSDSAAAATALSVSLRCLIVLTNAQCQLLDIQRAVFGVAVTSAKVYQTTNDADTTTATATADNTSQDSGQQHKSSSSSTKLALAEAATAVTLLQQTLEQTVSLLGNADSVNVTNSIGNNGKGDNENYTDATTATAVTPNNSEPAAMPLIRNLIHELSAWKYCLGTCAALERCK